MTTLIEGLLATVVFCMVAGCAIMGPGPFFLWLGSVLS